MFRRAPLGNLVLACAIAVLAAAAYASLRHAADARSAGVAAFTRDAAGRSGVLTDPAYRRAFRVAAVCALHQPAAGQPANFRLCGVLTTLDGFVFVRRFYHCRLGTRCAPPPRPVAKVQP